MKSIMTGLLITGGLFAIACGGANATSNTATTTKPASESKTDNASGSPTETVKTVYANAIKRDCAAIPPVLTEDFKKAVGTSKDGLDALCDSLTDSGKLSSFEVKSETVNGDAATVRVELKYKDGKTENKEERSKKVAGKWLLDS